MSGVVFKNQTFTYDTTAKNALVTGTLPNGVEVSYVGNGKTDVGTYTVTAKFNGDSNNYHLIEDMTATLKINQAVPYIKEVSCNQSLNLYSAVELIADTEVAGTISLDNGQTLTLGYKTYSWTFVPEDTHNYTNATGMVGLTVCALVSYYNDGVLFNSQNIVLNNSAYIPTGTPLREDGNGYTYTFSHWSIEENGAEYNFTNAITADLNLYAVYDSEEIVYAINYYDTKGVEHTNITTYTVATQYTLIDIEKEHYVFNGWEDENGKSTTQIVKGTFGTLNLYATWTPIEYAITYDLGYRGAVNGNNPTTYNVEDTFSFENATYDEYHTFVGWYLEENCVNQKSSISVGESGEITLYAKWNFSGTYISTVSELQNMAYNMAGVYELKNDIDLTNASWTAIGDSTNPFTGYFNGADYSINGKTPFGIINGTVNNLKSNVKIGDTNNGTISYCNAKGIVCYNTGSITYCYSDGYALYEKKESSSYYYFGSIVGYNTGTVSYCYADAVWSGYFSSKSFNGGGGSAYGYFGGLVGYSSTTVLNSYVNCAFTAEAYASAYYDSYYGYTYGSTCCVYVGGICGVGSANSCYTTGTITTKVKYGAAQSHIYINLYCITNGQATNCFTDCVPTYKESKTCTSNGGKCYYYSNVYSCTRATYTSKYNLTSTAFLRNNLGWDESIWYLQDGQYPKLRFELE